MIHFSMDTCPSRLVRIFLVVDASGGHVVGCLVLVLFVFETVLAGRSPVPGGCLPGACRQCDVLTTELGCL